MTSPAEPSARKRVWAYWLVALGISLTAITAAGPTLHLRLGGWAFIAVFAICSIGAFLATRLGEQLDAKTALIIIACGAISMRLALLFTEPTLSTDIYRYIWDGRVQAAGINPYRYVPAAPELASLRDPAIWPLINRADYAVTIYPPVAQAYFLAITRIGESVVVMKLGLVLFEVVTVVAILVLLHRLAKPIALVAAYAWHPLPVWEIAGNGHVDAAMVALMMLGLLGFLSGRPSLAGVLATLGALVKPIAVLALPVYWRPWDWKLPIVALVTLVIAYLPYLSVGTGVLGFVQGYIEEEGFREGRGFRLVWLIEQFTGPLPFAGAVYASLAALVLGLLALAVAFRSERTDFTAVRSLSWLIIVFLVLTTPHYPWYFLAVAPFLAIYPTATAWTLCSGGAYLYFVYPDDTMPGYEARFATLTVAALVALAYDIWAERRAVPVAIGETS
jgi:alpha-1,6-mannosyltransferase